MRTVIHGDVVAAAMAVRTLPASLRGDEIIRYLDRAHAADAYRKRLGKVHPFWGNGSLASAVGRVPAAEPFLSDTQYLEALSSVFETLLDWRRRA